MELNLKERNIDRTVAQSDGFKESFYKNWPETKAVLTTLKTVIRNPLAKLVVNLAIQVGDFVYDRKPD